MQEVYKVVKQVTSDASYFVSLNVEGKYQVVYTPGREVRVPHLFVFQTLEDARGIVTGSSAVIWRCMTPETYAVPPYVLNIDLIEAYGKQLWSGSLEQINPLFLYAPPPGTILCDALTLLERMP